MAADTATNIVPFTIRAWRQQQTGQLRGHFSRVSRALRCGGDCAQDANGHTIYSVSAGQGCPDEGLMGGFQL